MSLLRLGRPTLQRLCAADQRTALASLRWSPSTLDSRLQWRSQHNSRKPPRHFGQPSSERKSPIQQIREEQVEIIPPTAGQGQYSSPGSQYSEPGYEEYELPNEPWPKVRVRYLRPAIWSLTVTAGIFSGLAYYQAKKEIEQAKKATNWFQAPQWGLQPQSRAGPPSATELATRWWSEMNPISKVTWGIIGANSAVHLTSYLVPRYWDLLWHIPARNVNYTNFTSMFVHS